MIEREILKIGYAFGEHNLCYFILPFKSVRFNVSYGFVIVRRTDINFGRGIAVVTADVSHVAVFGINNTGLRVVASGTNAVCTETMI